MRTIEQIGDDLKYYSYELNSVSKEIDKTIVNILCNPSFTDYPMLCKLTGNLVMKASRIILLHEEAKNLESEGK